MKKIICILGVFIIMSSCLVGALYAEDKLANNDTGSPTAIQTDKINYDKTPLNKLGRGTINVATCWAEVPAEVIETSEEKGALVGFTLGGAKGLFTGLIRGITGAYDAITFIFPPYDKPPMEPEYSVKNMDDKMQKYLW